jgi:hypothetical protein
MPESIANAQQLRGRLIMAGTSVPKIAKKHGANVWTVYAALYGKRPGRDKRVQKALEEIRRA